MKIYGGDAMVVIRNNAILGVPVRGCWIKQSAQTLIYAAQAHGLLSVRKAVHIHAVSSTCIVIQYELQRVNDIYEDLSIVVSEHVLRIRRVRYRNYNSYGEITNRTYMCSDSPPKNTSTCTFCDSLDTAMTLVANYIII